jgi:hypothetical protein
LCGVIPSVCLYGLIIFCLATTLVWIFNRGQIPQRVSTPCKVIASVLAFSFFFVGGVVVIHGLGTEVWRCAKCGFTCDVDVIHVPSNQCPVCRQPTLTFLRMKDDGVSASDLNQIVPVTHSAFSIPH